MDGAENIVKAWPSGAVHRATAPFPGRSRSPGRVELEIGGRRGAAFLHHRHILVELLRAHPHLVGPTIRHRAVAGEDDPIESRSFPGSHIFGGMAGSVLAQRGVHVGIEEEGLAWHCGRESKRSTDALTLKLARGSRASLHGWGLKSGSERSQCDKKARNLAVPGLREMKRNSDQAKNGMIGLPCGQHVVGILGVGNVTGDQERTTGGRVDDLVQGNTERHGDRCIEVFRTNRVFLD